MFENDNLVNQKEFIKLCKVSTTGQTKTTLNEGFNLKEKPSDILSIDADLAIKKATTLNDAASLNMAPRIRMMTLYAIAASESRLVAGTGNRSELYVGYFTKCFSWFI